MKAGTQIAYVPRHANGDIAHPDVEFGFVMSTSLKRDMHFCRYWRKGHLGELRTTANSELTPDDLLVEYQSVTQAVMDKALKQIDDESVYEGDR